VYRNESAHETKAKFAKLLSFPKYEQLRIEFAELFEFTYKETIEVVALEWDTKRVLATH